MTYENYFQVESKDHLIDAVKAYWQSRGFRVKKQTENEVLLSRGKNGYKWTAINPFKYYFQVYVTTIYEGDTSRVQYKAEVEDDLSKNLFRDIITQKEIGKFEVYIKDFSIGKPVNLRNISEVKLKKVWPIYILNLLFPGLGLLYVGNPGGYLLGILTIIMTVLGVMEMGNDFLTYNPSPLELIASVVFYILITSIAGILIILENYERIYEFDNQ